MVRANVALLGTGLVGAVALLAAVAHGETHHRSTSVTTPSATVVDRSPPLVTAPGTPCVGATRVSEDELASLTRPFHVVIPGSTNGVGNLTTAWTCHGETGLFLEYDSGITVMEDDSTPFDNDPGGAAGYFRTAAARGDGQQIEVAGFPGSMTIGDGRDPQGVVVQFIGGGDRILVRTNDPSTDPAWLTAIAHGIARQLT